LSPPFFHGQAEREWPDGRSVFVGGPGDSILALMNEEDHLQLTTGEAGTDLRRAFERLFKALAALQDYLEEQVGA
jgi:protein-arginine kinase